MKQAGLDLGSVNTKLVVLENGEQIYRQVIPSRFDSVQAGIILLKSYVEEQGEKPEKLVVTGYGRVNFPEGRVITEISCQGRGCHHYFPDYELILDLGGQDAKVIRKNRQGKVIQFIMNDKCAAGTGRFLDVILKGLDLTTEELSLAAEATPMPINSMCTVFAESEVITMLAKGTPKPEVIAGLFKSTAKRLANFVESVGHPDPLIFTGGGAHYDLLVRFLERELKVNIVIPPEPELTAAFGAALLA
ncbi:CoA-substrate-specific enzyme activase, putative [Desulfosporosinus acidiphilus SJ4]|uniref:CoA-substrate-specific enzyme activase, putative n=1 Tax=Desulfosporosinus acidiphilus (strain DSM 22704 / JCM 16185 / SJ4) TaxID=646529 RepID=I4D0J3_DESAJ|nr:acyl-CoA dehydratase activase [Desulfosporosinus acidiphilus]AFM39317.1 CoA-substrate-specific enzyme activase, putative [Desulfosporosinus acidiphilus SJ4]